MTSSAERLRVILAGIGALILSVGIARFAYTPMLPVMRAQAGLSALAGGWLATVNYAGYMSGALLASGLHSLRHKYTIYRWGLVTAVVTTIAMGMTDNVWIWAVLRYLSGFSSTAGLLLASGLILNWFIRTGQTPQLGLHFIGMGLGLALSGLAAVLMAGWVAWDVQWIALGLFGAAFFLPAWFWMPEPAPVAARQDGAAVTPPGARWMLLFTLSYFCAGFGYVVSATFIVAIVDRLPGMADKGNWVWVLVGLSALPSAFWWDGVARRWGAVQALMLAYALEAASILLPAISAGLDANLAAAVLFGGTFVGIVSLSLTLVGRFFPNNPAKAMARLTLSYGVAQIVAPAIAGILAARTGDYRDMLFFAAGAMVLGIGLLAALPRRVAYPA